MGKERYKITQKDDFADMIPLPTTHTVVVTDRVTGREEKASACTVEKATELAIEKTKK
jgi:hypothetical protein